MKPPATGALLLALLLAMLVTGCAPHRYRAVPLAPAATAAALDNRSLDDPELYRWMKQHASFEAPSWPLQAWDLDALTLAAYYFNPDLDVARANAAAAEAAMETAAMKPNPAVSVGPGYQGPNGSQFITLFDLSLPIETAGKRGYRMADAAHLSAASRLQLGQTAWIVRSRVRATLVDYLFATQAAEAFRKEAVLRQEGVRLTEARLRAGEISFPELTTANVDLTSVRQALGTAEGQVHTARTAMAAALGVPDAALSGKALVWQQASSPPAPTALPSRSVRRLALENRLDIQRALEQYEAAQSVLQLEIARQYPDINIGPGYSYEEGTNFISLVLSSVLPLRNRNEGPIAEAEALRKLAGAQLIAGQSAALEEIDRSQAQYAAAFANLEAATVAVKQIHDQQGSVLVLVKAGEAEQLAFIAAELQTAVAERARLEALHQVQLALGLVEDAVQRPIEPANVPTFPSSVPRP